MGSERGQAAVEWIGLVLVLMLGLAALVRLAPRDEGRELASALAHSVSCAARGGCGAESRAPGSEPARAVPGGSRATRGPPSRSAPDRFVSVPPLVPVTRGEGRPAPRARPAPRLDPRLLRRARRAVGLAWRRAWVICLGYERARYGLSHPGWPLPHHAIGSGEAVRMANDCLSPVDMIRDFGPLPRPD